MSRLACGFTGHGQNLRDLFRGEFVRGPTSRGAPQHLFDGAAEGGARIATLDGYQGVERLPPTSPPQTDLLTVALPRFERGIYPDLPSIANCPSLP